MKMNRQISVVVLATAFCATSCSRSADPSTSNVRQPETIAFRQFAGWEPVYIGLIGASPEQVQEKLGPEQDVSGIQHASTYITDGVLYRVEFESNRVARTFKAKLEPVRPTREQLNALDSK
jgi:hypothetical protein